MTAQPSGGGNSWIVSPDLRRRGRRDKQTNATCPLQQRQRIRCGPCRFAAAIPAQQYGIAGPGSNAQARDDQNGPTGEERQAGQVAVTGAVEDTPFARDVFVLDGVGEGGRSGGIVGLGILFVLSVEVAHWK